MSTDRHLPEREAARRQRGLRAALELAGEGGYDSVLMRAVADRAGVALGTVYHYFSSKDHLLAESMIERIGSLRRGVLSSPATGASTLDRVLDILGRSTSAMGENEQASAALLAAIVAEGQQIAECQEDLHALFSEMVNTAFDESFPAGDRDLIVRSLEHVWFSVLIAWKNQWMSYSQATSELEDAARMLLAGRD